MFAMLGMYVQAITTGKGPVANWSEHIADPGAVNAWNYATKFTPTLQRTRQSSRSCLRRVRTGLVESTLVSTEKTHGWVRSSTELQQDLVQARCRLPGRHTGKLHQANQSLYANY